MYLKLTILNFPLFWGWFSQGRGWLSLTPAFENWLILLEVGLTREGCAAPIPVPFPRKCRLHCDDLIGLMITQGQREGTASLHIPLIIFWNIQCNLCTQWDNRALSWLLAFFFSTCGAIPGLSLEHNPQTVWKRYFWERLISSVSQEMEQLQVSHAGGHHVLLLSQPGP